MGYQEGEKVDWQKLMPLRGFLGYCLAEMGGRADILLVRTKQRRMSKDYERLCASAEAFV
jgi:hypothetical protein